MLTRLYIDNFRCFEKFEWKPGRKQLILGRNGTGKTSLMWVIQALVEVAAHGERVDKWFRFDQRTRWLDQSQMTFELDALVRDRSYSYCLTLALEGTPPHMAVSREELTGAGAQLLFEEGSLTARSAGGRPVTLKMDPSRTTLATAGDEAFAAFRGWLGGISCWHPIPELMGSRADAPEDAIRVDLSNFVGWYWSLVKKYAADENAAFLNDLRESLSGFDQLVLKEAGGGAKILYAAFRRNAQSHTIPFSELSDGQKYLICFYAIAHFVIAEGGTVIVDEPDNFISLSEIQPWLNRIEEMADDHKGQVILISHHPEILNQWAPSYGVQFIREGAGPVRVEKFKGDPESPLSAAELVARGWDLD